MADLTIDIDLNKKCVECGKGGAQPSGLCLACVSRAMSGKTMKTRNGKVVAARFKTMREERNARR